MTITCPGSHQLPLMTGPTRTLPGPGEPGLCPVCGQRVQVWRGGYVADHTARRHHIRRAA